jgi:hypothetical protein
MDLAEHTGIKATGNLPELPNMTFMLGICWVPNGNNNQTSGMQPQAGYSDVRHLKELIDFIEKHCCPKEPYSLPALYKCNLTQGELHEE